MAYNIAGSKRVKQTHHSLERMATRLGVTNEKNATEIILAAKRYGASPQKFPECPLKDFLYIKSVCKNLKVYKGFIFVFNKNSRRAITVYKVPDKYLNDLKNSGLDKVI